jgi:hypothetical protein
MKRLMLACFATQARVLSAFRCDYEAVRASAPADFTCPPPSGRVWFERQNWGITGATWRAAAAEVARRIAAEGWTC